MRRNLRLLSLVFAAGAAGAVVNSLAVWLAGGMGITRAMHVAIAPALTAAWLYPRIVWGGLWGFLFLVVTGRGPLARGLIASLGPALFQLFVVFPYWTHQGTLGVHLGHLTPVAVLAFSAIWGVSASYWLRATD